MKHLISFAFLAAAIFFYVVAETTFWFRVLRRRRPAKSDATTTRWARLRLPGRAITQKRPRELHL
jgi:hypothetical protein